MRSVKLRLVLTLLIGGFVAGCALSARSPAPQTRITLISVSDKADLAQGLDMVYVYGTSQSIFNHVSCNHAQTCWFSGDMAAKGTSGKSLSPIIIQTGKDGSLAWAKTYRVDHFFTNTNGLLPAGDGGSLLYGNSFIGTRYRNYSKGRIQPIYEKLDASGNPQWGGTVPFGFIEPWSAATDAIKLADGGYALTGSGTLNADGDWYGLVLAVKSNGRLWWMKYIRLEKSNTFSMSLYQLENNHILALGYDASISDMFLVDLAKNGDSKGISIIHIRGDEIPVGLVPLKDGPAIVARQKMPSGEIATLVVQLNDKGDVEKASRYRYVDGFNPSDVIPLPGHRACVYGYTEAKDRPESLAFIIDATGKPYSALTLKGRDVFNSGAVLTPKELVFAGGRALGVKQRESALIVRWNPSLDNEEDVLKKITLDKVKVRQYRNQPGKVASPVNPTLHIFDRSEMQTQVVHSGPLENGDDN
jgi:hypothetical protein